MLHRHNLVICLGLALLTLAAFWPVLRFDFVNYDDDKYVTANPHVLTGLTWTNVAWAFQTTYASFWHPLTWLSHMLDCQLYGTWPGGHHLTNLLLHIANTLLLFLLLQRLTGAPRRSALVAALFAIHPLHVESVAWVAERKDVLSTLFFLLTLLAYERYVRKTGNGTQLQGGGSRRFAAQGSKLKVQASRSRSPAPSSILHPPSSIFYIVALVSFALGRMAKPMLMTLPFLLVLLDYWPLGRFELKTKSLRLKTFVPLLAEKTPFLALAVVSGLVAVWAHNQGGKLAFREPIPVAPRVANALVSYARYLAKTLWPDHLAVFYPLPPAWPAWQVAGAVLLLAAASLAALALARRYPALFTGWFWFLGTLVPVIGFVQVGTFSFADRFTYFPLIGLFVAGAWGLGYLLNLWPQCRLLLLAAACSSLAACGWRASVQVQLWQNSETLFAHAIRVTPDNYIAYNNLGTALDHSGQTEAALECFAQALRIKPDHPEAHLNLALALTGQKKYTEAVAHYEAALRFAPADAQAHNNLANLLDLLGRVAEALPHYLAALQIKPDFPEAEYNLAGVLAGQGRLQDAVAHYQTALRLAPQNASAHYNLARLLAKLGRLQEAKDHYLAALRLNPRHSSACYNLGNLLLRLGEPQEAIAHFTAALQLEPDFPEAHFSLGKTLLSQGQAEPGILHLRTALRLKPDWAPALNQLAWTLATHPLPQIRDGNQAIPLAEKLCEMTGHRQPAPLATLAAAYAETSIRRISGPISSRMA